MNAIIFGVVVAIGISGYVVTIADSVSCKDYDVWTMLLATICTGIAAGMVY